MFTLDDTARRTWVIRDIITIVWLVYPDWVPTFMTTSPWLNEGLFREHDPARHLMRGAHDVQRDEIFFSFCEALARG